MSCGLPLPGRGLAAGALSAFATVLGVSAKVAEQGATLLRGDHAPASAEPEPMPWDRPAPGAAPEPVDGWDDPVTGPPDDPDGAVGVVVEDLADADAVASDDLLAVDTSPPGPVVTSAAAEPPLAPVAPEPAADVTHVREPDTHAAELAARPAVEVIAAVERLSTDELSALYDEETRSKRRKTVLAAIEAALTP